MKQVCTATTFLTGIYMYYAISIFSRSVPHESMTTAHPTTSPTTSPATTTEAWEWSAPISPVQWTCERPVSSIICVHKRTCPQDCGPGGVCDNGKCVCEENWVGARCNTLQCAEKNCTDHGLCSTGELRMEVENNGYTSYFTVLYTSLAY